MYAIRSYYAAQLRCDSCPEFPRFPRANVLRADFLHRLPVVPGDQLLAHLVWLTERVRSVVGCLLDLEIFAPPTFTGADGFDVRLAINPRTRVALLPRQVRTVAFARDRHAGSSYNFV